MISDLSGFSSPKVLARLFRAEESMSLRDYRRRRGLGQGGLRRQGLRGLVDRA